MARGCHNLPDGIVYERHLGPAAAHFSFAEMARGCHNLPDGIVYERHLGPAAAHFSFAEMARGCHNLPDGIVYERHLGPAAAHFSFAEMARGCHNLPDVTVYTDCEKLGLSGFHPNSGCCRGRVSALPYSPTHLRFHSIRRSRISPVYLTDSLSWSTIKKSGNIFYMQQRITCRKSV